MRTKRLKVDERESSLQLQYFPSGPSFVSSLSKLAFHRSRVRACVSSVMGGFNLVGLFLFLCCTGCAVAQFAIPERYDGFVYNGKPDPVMRGPVLWEVFIDPLCIDCKNGWPQIKRVADRYGPSLVVIVHPFPAPFHHNAFFASRALHVAQMTNASLVYPLLELIFANQDSFSNPSTNHEAPAHVVTRLISLATELGISANSFEAGFNDAASDQATRSSFKYGCSRGVVATPTYLVNGVGVTGADESWTVDDWAKIFDPIVKGNGFGMTYPSSYNKLQLEKRRV